MSVKATTTVSIEPSSTAARSSSTLSIGAKAYPAGFLTAFA
jgi:hypothetical protein